MGDLQKKNSGFMGVIKSLTMSRNDLINARNRSVTDYKPCAVDAFFEPANGLYNVVASGGHPAVRSAAIEAQTLCAISNGFPVIVLHESNSELAGRLRRSISPIGKYLEISPHSPCYEPFYGLSELEIANEITETAPKEFDLKFNARYYIDGISTFIKKKGKNLSFNMFSTCPHAMLFDKVDELQLQGHLSDPEAQDIKSKLMMGQSESLKIESYIADLKMQMSPMMYHSRQGFKPMNVLTALKQNAVLCFDISAATNKLLINTIVYQCKLALIKGIQFALIIDSIPTNANEAYEALIKASPDKIVKMISSDDLFAMVGGDDKLFAAIVGNSQTTIVMSHTSGHSARMWAEVFGEYDKLEESYSTSRGSSRRSPFSPFSSPNYNRTVNVSRNREYIVKPEVIMRMGQTEAFILSAARGELAHLQLIV